MDRRDLLKSMLQNFINDKAEDAKQDFHQYLTIMSKEITGLGSGAAPAAAQEAAPAATPAEPAAATPEGGTPAATATPTPAEPASATQE